MRIKTDVEPSQDSSRRDFVKGTIVATVGVAVAAAVPASVMAEQVVESDQPAKQKGYHLSKHILDYYKVAAQ